MNRCTFVVRPTIIIPQITGIFTFLYQIQNDINDQPFK